MRQTGYLVGCAAYALTYNFPLLPRVHSLAKHMQRGLEDIGVGILSPAETCIVGRPRFVFVIETISDHRFPTVVLRPLHHRRRVLGDRRACRCA